MKRDPRLHSCNAFPARWALRRGKSSSLLLLAQLPEGEDFLAAGNKENGEAGSGRLLNGHRRIKDTSFRDVGTPAVQPGWAIALGRGLAAHWRCSELPMPGTLQSFMDGASPRAWKQRQCPSVPPPTIPGPGEGTLGRGVSSPCLLFAGGFRIWGYAKAAVTGPLSEPCH